MNEHDGESSHNDPTYSETDVHEAYRERYARAAESDGHRAAAGTEPGRDEMPRAGLADGGAGEAPVGGPFVSGRAGHRHGFEPQFPHRAAGAAFRSERIHRRDGITMLRNTIDPQTPLIDRIHCLLDDPASVVDAPSVVPRVPAQRRSPDLIPPPAPVPARPERPPLRTVEPEICSAGRIPCRKEGARLYPGGWFCDRHRPGAPADAGL
ncbi:hypothetical protein ACWGB8_21515 [Kitasatospora sp. NPDC054939]